ncbi:MAG: hypothetical protein MAG431_00484 [Chloroflexi bacterium]|nr:hypothetical protein [Chloroflexota bacterium]
MNKSHRVIVLIGLLLSMLLLTLGFISDIVPVRASDGESTIFFIYTGTIDLQRRDDDSGANITAMGGSAGAFSASTKATGYYELTLPADTYNLTADMGQYLKGEQIDRPCLGGVVYQLPTIILLGGDVNDDCTINILDLAFMGARFGTSTGDTDFDPLADINADGTVNILDLTLAGANFMQECPVDWETPLPPTPTNTPEPYPYP